MPRPYPPGGHPQARRRAPRDRYLHHHVHRDRPAAFGRHYAHPGRFLRLAPVGGGELARPIGSWLKNHEPSERGQAMADGDDFNGKVIAEFRANGGKVGGFFDGQPLLLLHHAGAKTGAERVNPLVYLQVGSSYAIFASAGGQPRDPQWFRNLVAGPDVTAEIGTSTVKARARVTEGDERAAIWATQKERMPHFADYELNAAPREIPVVLLDPVA